MMQDIARRVESYGGRPDNLDEEAALRDMRDKANLYGQEDKNVVPMCLDRIKILQRSLDPIPAMELASPEAGAFLRGFETMIERPAEELEALRSSGGLVEPYWDAGLRKDRGRRVQLYQMLWKSGLLDFRRRRKARVGLFTVRKKQNWQRLIVDARQANFLQQAPPTARLATAAGLAAVDLSAHSLGIDVEAEGYEGPAGETGDVGDCFYNFKVDSLTSWFGTDDIFTPLELRTFGIVVASIYDDDLRGYSSVDPQEPLYACFSGVPMGWSWALWLAQDIVCHQSLLALGLSSDSLIRDRCPAPQVKPESPAVGIYVDNVHVFAAAVQEARDAMDKIQNHFSELGIPFETDHVAGKPSMDTLGLTFEFGKEVRVRARSDRVWKLWGATRALIRRRRISGDVLRVWLGHVNFHFQLSRPALSAISACYKFVADHVGHRHPMWPSVRKELKTVLGLLFITEKSLSAEVCRDVHLGDSSDRGFALMTTEASVCQIRRELRYSERWRFVQSPGSLDTQPLGEDLWDAESPADEADIYHKGSAPYAGVGSRTEYGQALDNKYNQAVEDPVFQSRRDRLFGTPRTRPPTMLEVFPVPEVSNFWHDATRWDLLVSSPWQHVAEHINVKEARVCLMGLRRLCRTSVNLGKIALTLTDNLVSALVFEKGRSSSGPLNALCRKAAAYSLGGSIQWRLRHIRSEHNCADAPSRRWGSDLPRVKRPLPSPFLGRHLTAASLEQTTEKAMGSMARGETPPTVAQSTRPFRKAPPRYVLELFSGSAVLTQALKGHGMRTLPDIDISKGKAFDLTIPRVQSYICSMLKAGMIWYIHMGTPCTVFSRARHNIKDFRKARQKETLGVACALFSAEVARLCLRKNIWFSLENPLGSRLWEFGPILELLKNKCICFVQFTMCAYNTQFKKPTGLMTNCPHLSRLQAFCPGNHAHTVLKGTERVKIDGKWLSRNRTTGAGEYPRKLCQTWAQILFEQAPTGSLGRTSFIARNDFEANLHEAANISGSQGQPDLGPSCSAGCSENANPVFNQARKYIQTHSVIFGQFTKDQIRREQCKRSN